MRLHLVDLASATLADGSNSALAPRDAALLAWLALEGPTPRARLAELLWPGSEPEAARNTLRQRLFHLKKHCGELVSGGSALRLGVAVQHDLGADVGVLGDLQFPDAPDLNRWLNEQRERRITGQRRELEAQVRALESAGELAAALPVAQALLQLDTLSEAAHRHLMRLHYLRGDRAAALLAFDHCERTLKDEVGTRPSAETLALLQTIEQAHPHTWMPGQALPASALRPPQLIGRETELGELASAWSAGRLFIVAGQAGSGKSRLLDAMSDAQPGTLVLRARPGDDKVPLATLDRLVHRLSERWPALGAEPACARFKALISGPGDDRAPSVQSAVPMLADLLYAARRHGLGGLVLDDLQFADDASIDTWQELLDWPALAGLPFGFASRVEGDAASQRIGSLGKRGDAIVLPLQPLDAAAIESFVESLALPTVDAKAIAAALARRIGGNPLHLLETIRHALEKHGHLSADKLEAPARVTELLEQRLLALRADGLLVVRIAAVAGNDFGPELAAAVSRRDVLELADAWHALERQGLLDARGFMHDLIGEAAHRLLPQPIARVLHARVAAYLAQHGAGAARLAHHWLCAGDDAAAAPHLAVAARQAWQLGRSREAREAYGRAASIELSRGRPDAAFDLLFDCAESITEIGPSTEFEQAVDRLEPLARTPSQRARVAFLRIVGFHQRGDHAVCRERIDDALVMAIDSGDRVIEAECRFSKGVYATHDGHLHEASQHFAAAVALHRSIGREARALAIELNNHLILLWTGQARIALDRQREELQGVLDSGSPKLLAMLLVRQADGALHLGDLGAARLTVARALEALRATDMIGAELASTARNIADIERRCGHWDAALAIANESTERLGAQKDPEQLLASVLADIYLDLGRPDLAHRHVEAFATVSRHSVRQRQRALALRWRYSLALGSAVEAAVVVADAVGAENLLQACRLALIAGQASDPDLSAGSCAALIVRSQAHELREQLTPLHALLAWLLARSGDTAAALVSVGRAEVELEKGELGAWTPHSGLWLAKALQCANRVDAADRHARSAAAWLNERAQRTVPPGFRDSFMRRNPVHRDVLAWPTRTP
jgi:DNA-binding SARP family transcriptional activator